MTANVAPRLCAEFQEATLKGDYATALALQDRLMPLHHAMFVETSPGPVKYAASLLGLCERGSAPAHGAGGRIDQEGGARGDDPRRAPELR